MGHKTIVNGTSYDIVGGVTKINATKYNIDHGVTKISGTKHLIELQPTFDWGADGELVDKAWMTKLHDFLQRADNETIAACIPVGGYKQIVLSSTNYVNSGYVRRDRSSGKYLWNTKLVYPIIGNPHIYGDDNGYYYWSNTPGSNKSDNGDRIPFTSSTVLGSSTCYIQVIGVNQDADKTVTFQTKNCLNNEMSWIWVGTSGRNTVYSAASHYENSHLVLSSPIYEESDDPTTTLSAAGSDLIYLWANSFARDGVCYGFKDYIPGNEYIVPVTKGTYISGSVYKDEKDYPRTIRYRDEYVFLLSGCEIGYGPAGPYNLSEYPVGAEECTYGKNFVYQYYEQNHENEEKLRKKLGDSPDAKYARFWLRSFYSASYGNDFGYYLCSFGTNSKYDSSDPTSKKLRNENHTPYMSYRNRYFGTLNGYAPAFVIG